MGRETILKNISSPEALPHRHHRLTRLVLERHLHHSHLSTATPPDSWPSPPFPKSKDLDKPPPDSAQLLYHAITSGQVIPNLILHNIDYKSLCLQNGTESHIRKDST